MKNTQDFLDDFKSTLKKDDALDLVFDFFIIFSRFECALKTSGYLKNKKGWAEPDWDKFEKYLPSNHKNPDDKKVKDAIKYIIENPPKKQMNKDSKLYWENRKDSSLSKLIRRVRNNLFHGGKFYGDYNKEDSRNRKLLENCIIILDYWLSLNESVKDNFNTPIIDPYYEK